MKYEVGKFSGDVKLYCIDAIDRINEETFYIDVPADCTMEFVIESIKVAMGYSPDIILPDPENERRRLRGDDLKRLISDFPIIERGHIDFVC